MTARYSKPLQPVQAVDLSLHANGLVQHWECSGPDALPIVLLHGMGLDLSVWRDQIGALANRWRVLAVDLRGHGLSDPSDDEVVMVDDLAADLDAGLHELGVREPVVLVGSSLGGLTAHAYASARPERVRAAAFISTRARPDDDAARHARAALAAELRATGSTDAFRREMFDRYLAPYSYGRADLVDRLLAMQERTSADTLAALLVGLARRETMPSEPSHMPVLIAFGEDDALVPREQMIDLAQAFPRARVAAIPGAGHLPSLERPRALTRLLTTFLEEIEP